MDIIIWIKIPFKHYSGGGTFTILGGGTTLTNRGFHIDLKPRKDQEYANIRYGFYHNDMDLLISNSPTNIETILQKNLFILFLYMIMTAHIMKELIVK